MATLSKETHQTLKQQAYKSGSYPTSGVGKTLNYAGLVMLRLSHLPMLTVTSQPVPDTVSLIYWRVEFVLAPVSDR